MVNQENQNDKSSELLELLLKDIFEDETANNMLCSGANINWTNEKNETFLHLSVKGNCLDSVIWLIEKGLNIEAQTDEGLTPIFYTLKNDSSQILKYLIENNANINHKNKVNKNLLQESVLSYNAKILDTLFLFSEKIDNISDYSYSMIYDTLLEGKREILINNTDIENLDLNNTDSNQDIYLLSKSLSLFFKNKNIDDEKKENILSITKKLINNVININAQDDRGETVLFKIIKRNDIESTKYLIQNVTLDMDIFNQEGDSALSLASYKGIENIEMISLLLNFGANATATTDTGESLIENLINIILFLSNKKNIPKKLSEKINKNSDYMSVLIKILDSSIVNLNILNSNGKPLFFDTVIYGHNSLFKLLTQYKININLKDADEKNILYNLMQSTPPTDEVNEKTVATVLKNMICIGADVNSRDKLDRTVVHTAVLEQSDFLLKVILNSKTDFYAVDNKGRTLIHNCVWKNKIKHFKLIHTYAQDIVNIPDHFGILPINYAAFIGNINLVLEMIDSGAHLNNIYAKKLEMLNYLKNFYNNLDHLQQDISNELDKKNIGILIDNMKKEFIHLSK